MMKHLVDLGVLIVAPRRGLPLTLRSTCLDNVSSRFRSMVVQFKLSVFTQDQDDLPKQW